MLCSAISKRRRDQCGNLHGGPMGLNFELLLALTESTLSSFALTHPFPMNSRFAAAEEDSRKFHFRVSSLVSTHHRLRKIDVSLGIRCFSSGSFDSSNEEIESKFENDVEDDEIEVDSSADPEEVERVCKVIDELFALDRNMEAVLDEMKLDLIVEVLERFRHARKPAFRFFRL